MCKHNLLRAVFVAPPTIPVFLALLRGVEDRIQPFWKKADDVRAAEVRVDAAEQCHLTRSYCVIGRAGRGRAESGLPRNAAKGRGACVVPLQEVQCGVVHPLRRCHLREAEQIERGPEWVLSLIHI